MKYNWTGLFIVVCVAVELFSASTALTQDKQEAEGRLTFVNRFEVVSNNISGPGRSSSFYTEGIRYNEEMDILAENKLLKDIMSRIEFSFRVTDNPQIDKETVSVEKFRWNLKNKKNDLTLGDYFANFSQYTMSKSIKGIGYQYNFTDEKNYLRVAAGTFDSQWEYIYHDPKINNAIVEPMNRYGGGARLQKAGKKYRFGLNLAYIDDDQSDPHRGTQDAYRQSVGALDWEYRFTMCRLRGEHAYSSSLKQTTATGDTNLYGNANKITLKGEFAKFGIQAKFENVTPDFNTIGGGATSDRRRYYAKVSRKLAKLWQIYGSFNESYNHLSGSTSTTRTSNRTYETGVSRKKLFDRKRMKATLSLRRKDSFSDDNSRDKVTDRIKFSISDTLAKVYRYRLNLQNTTREDKIANTDRETLLSSMNLSSRYRFKNKWRVRPSIFLSYRTSDNLITVSAGDQDRVVNYRFRVAADKGQNKLGAGFSRIDNNISEGTDSRINRLNLNWEHKLKPASLFEQLKFTKDVSFKIDYKYNDNKFIYDNPQKDYRESLLTASLRLKF